MRRDACVQVKRVKKFDGVLTCFEGCGKAIEREVKFRGGKYLGCVEHAAKYFAKAFKFSLEHLVKS